MAILARTENIVLEIDGESPFKQIVAQQGDDNTLVVKILLLYKKQRYMIPEGVTPRIKYIKPDGYQVLNDCDVDEDGNVVVTYTEQMLSSFGTGKGQLLFISEGKELKTPLFYTKIYPAAYGKEIPESTTEYKTFNRFLDECSEQATASANSANSAKQYASLANEQATASANSANSAKEYYDKIQGEYVTGVKGEQEEKFRSGEVSITAENIGAVKENGDTKNNVVTFESEDGEAKIWSDVETLSSAEKHSSLFKKISTMFKNIRFMYKLLGTTDISSIKDGTVTGAVSDLNSNLTTNITECISVIQEGANRFLLCIDAEFITITTPEDWNLILTLPENIRPNREYKGVMVLGNSAEYTGLIRISIYGEVKVFIKATNYSKIPCWCQVRFYTD